MGGSSKKIPQKLHLDHEFVHSFLYICLKKPFHTGNLRDRSYTFFLLRTFSDITILPNLTSGGVNAQQARTSPKLSQVIRRAGSYSETKAFPTFLFK